MAELIDHKALKEALLERGIYPAIVKLVLEKAPTVDAVPVVRCKDCIRRYDTDECPMCFLIGGRYYEFTQGNGFCDRGERKEDA